MLPSKTVPAFFVSIRLAKPIASYPTKLAGPLGPVGPVGPSGPVYHAILQIPISHSFLSILLFSIIFLILSSQFILYLQYIILKVKKYIVTKCNNFINELQFKYRLDNI